METRGIAEGMAVRAGDGKKLGKVIECAEGSFVVEKGLFFPKDFSVRYDQVAEVRGDEVYLNVANLDLGEASAEPITASPSSPAVGGSLGGAGLGAAGTPAGAGMGAGIGAISDAVRGDRGPEETRSDVREEVRVDRVPAQGSETPGEAAFRDRTVSVPVHEEEIEITKRPVVKEEVRVGRTRRQEERRADADVLREEARIEGAEELTSRDDQEPREGSATRDFDEGSDRPRSDIDDPERR